MAESKNDEVSGKNQYLKLKILTLLQVDKTPKPLLNKYYRERLRTYSSTLLVFIPLNLLYFGHM